MHFVPVNFSDPGFNPAYTANFELLIILNQQQFGYAVRHLVTQRLVRINTGISLDEIWYQEEGCEWLASAYTKVIIAVETPNFCLIPNAVFSKEDLLDYAAFLVVKEADVILTDQIESGQNTVVFTFPGDLISKLTAQFNTSVVEFAPKGWIKTVMGMQRTSRNLHLFLEENKLQLLFAESDHIRFYNQFDWSTLDELTYFTALVTKQLDLKPEDINLILCGKVEENSAQQLHLQQFFEKVSLYNFTDFRQHTDLPQYQVTEFLGLV